MLLYIKHRIILDGIIETNAHVVIVDIPRPLRIHIPLIRIKPLRILTIFFLFKRILYLSMLAMG